MQLTSGRVFRVAAISLTTLVLQIFACNAGRRVEVLIAASKPYDSVIERVHSVSGEVRYEFQNIDAIAATIPVAQLDAFEAMPEVAAIEKDRKLSLSAPRVDLETEGADYTYTIDPAETSGDVASFTEVAPEGYSPVEVDLMGASDFWSATGHSGDGVTLNFSLFHIY